MKLQGDGWVPGPRWALLVVLVSAAVGASSVAVAGLAGSGGEAAKREPVRDKPGAVTLADLPPGEHLWSLEEPRVHGGLFLVYPAGDPPSEAARKNPEPGEGWTYQKFYNLSRDELRSVLGVAVDDAALPAGYRFAGAGGFLAKHPDGRVFREAGFSIEGAGGFPIGVTVWEPWEWRNGEMVAKAAVLDEALMTTLGTVAGHPAVFWHRRPGVTTTEPQRVWVGNGRTMVAVESYLDDFSKLVRVAESVLSNLEEVTP
ncbi:MAG: hypothetical protein ACE5EF_08915 [Dehalococcoidia bacterium]